MLHTSQDSAGAEGGLGGGTATLPSGQDVSWNGPRDWTKEEYGYGGSCVDTARPFRVTAVFPTQVKCACVRDSGAETRY